MAYTAPLPLKIRLKLIRQAIYARLHIQEAVPVRLNDHPLGASVEVNNKTIIVPSPMRWKLYKKGWEARLDQLANEYGVGRHITLGADSMVLDIGANAGEFAHICARFNARVHCLEPDSKVYACLAANTKNLPNASIHNTLIWNENTELDFFSAPANADSSAFDEGQGPKIKKPAITVEQFCMDNDLTKIDLLKCDAEGAEPEMLSGIGSMFPHIKVIALDTGAERYGQRTNDACGLILKEQGFDVIEETIGKRLMTFGINKIR